MCVFLHSTKGFLEYGQHKHLNPSNGIFKWMEKTDRMATGLVNRIGRI